MSARGLNKVQLIGNLGHSPDAKCTDKGMSITNFSIATTESWVNKSTGQPESATEWHKVVCFGKLAEIAAQFLVKGSKVYVEGSLKTRKWTGKDGTEKTATEVSASNLIMLGGRTERSEGTSEPETEKNPDFDEDIPF